VSLKWRLPEKLLALFLTLRVKTNDVSVGMQTNGKGSVVRIFLYVKYKETADKVANAANNMRGQCVLGMCKVQSIGVKTLQEYLSGAHSIHDTSINILFMLIVAVFAAFLF